MKSARKKIKKHYNFHHPYPTSRAKNGDLGVFKPLLHPLTRKAQIPKHDLWHNLFLNLFAEEIISKIKKSFDEESKRIMLIFLGINTLFFFNSFATSGGIFTDENISKQLMRLISFK